MFPSSAFFRRGMELLIFYSTVVIVYTASVEAGNPRRGVWRRGVKKAKLEIDFTNPYYEARFEVCKKARIFNPVELVKAQAYVTETFRRCGPKMIVRLASKYNFPAYGEF